MATGKCITFLGFYGIISLPAHNAAGGARRYAVVRRLECVMCVNDTVARLRSMVDSRSPPPCIVAVGFFKSMVGRYPIRKLSGKQG